MTKRELVCAYTTNCELLDELSEENEELKSENQYLKSLKWNRDCIKEISIGMQQRQSLEISNNKLVKENEQLKTVINRYEKYSNKKNDELNFRQLDILKLKEENEQLKQQLSHIRGQLVMLDNCDNWDYNRMKYTVREIAEIMGYGGTINPKR